MNARYKVIYNKTGCVGAHRCMGIHPSKWGLEPDGKAVLNGGTLNPATGLHELEIGENDLHAYKESALICPAYVIDIVDAATGRSVLNIRPDKNKNMDGVPVIAAHYDSRKEWQMDPKGFFTVKIFPEENLIRMRYYGGDHALKAVCEGRTAEELYNTVVREKWVSTLQHAAYVGCELMKAEVALVKKLNYVQDDPLPL